MATQRSLKNNGTRRPSTARMSDRATNTSRVLRYASGGTVGGKVMTYTLSPEEIAARYPKSQDNSDYQGFLTSARPTSHIKFKNRDH